ncbi:ABC transporter family protein [Murinocardiopsis flavida]|uniref:ABC transporter family protein n=1 Tax=Murinocardiopsis flavida TaxID=645275 RepID=A0A2P8DIY4_9ACTN|nr:ATP-binding cassette domain-containing protein [Murinocardiopsis flavida]PSK97180.1 ABC transporter family protein [Murinocardiopsis flavida]
MRRATGVRVDAERLTLRTGEGQVYTGVDLSARPGTLTALRADAGEGRTALLLTLAGRMRPTSGSLTVDGHALPAKARQVRRISALGLSEGVNDLDERLRVREQLNERLLLRLRTATRPLRASALLAAGLDGIDPRRLVRDLSTAERRRLGIALALLDEPRLLLVDDVDAGLDPEHQAALWGTLADLADSGLTVIAACADTSHAPDPTATVPLHRDAETAEESRPRRRRGARRAKGRAAAKGTRAAGGRARLSELLRTDRSGGEGKGKP